MHDYLKLVSVEYVPPALLAVLIGFVFSNTFYAISIKLVFALMSAALVTCGYNSYNAIYDKKIDKINKPNRPLPSKIFTEAHVFRFSVTVFVLSVIFSILVGPIFIIIDLAAIILAVSYSHPLSSLRRSTLGFIVGVCIYAILFPLGGWAVNHVGAIPLPIIAFLVAFGIGSGMLKDFEDIKGDSKYGIRSLAYTIGRERGVVVSSAAFVISGILTVLSIFYHVFGLVYIFLLILILLAILNVLALLRSYNKRVARMVFMRGMLILTLVELCLLVIKVWF